MKLPKQDVGLIDKAYALFDEFYTALTPFREKCAANEEFWKTNHWHDVAKKEADEPRPVTPVLFSTLESLLADIMDNFPEAHIFAEQAGDDKLAKVLTKAVKGILRKRNYRKTYREKVRSALKKGVSVQEVFWDATLAGGLGDINVRAWDIRNFLFDPTTENIQDGRAVFKFGFFHEDWIKANYPSALNKMKTEAYAKTYVIDFACSNEDTHLVVEYWYKTIDAEGRSCVHMAKLSGGVLLEKSEAVRPDGMYAHGQYPFIVEPLYRLEGLPVGLGIIDVLKNLQQYADKLDQIILKNTLMSGKLKMLVNKNADVDEDAMLDWSKEVVTASRIDDGAVRWFQAAPLNPYVMAHMNGKLAAIKEESGQNQFVRGEAAKGVTAASAILALQNAGSKRSRMIIDQMYDGFSELIHMMVSLIAENYTEARVLRLDDEHGPRDTALFSDMMHYAYDDQGQPILKDGKKIPRYFEYDINIAVEKQTPYQTLYLNELALNLLRAGMIDKTEALSMMNFDGKDKVAAMVAERNEKLSKAAEESKSVN